jgi:transcriptional regulator with XRE-family HTH domain
VAWQTLGERIKGLRVKRGLTQKALADRLHMSAVFIKKVEAGGRLPSLPNLDRIARALGVTLQIDLVERFTRKRKGRG